jgi:hypothetical protein
MRFSQIISEMSTTAGSVSTVAKPLGEVAKRPQVDGLQPAAKVMSGKAKKKGPYANSLSESKKRVEEADLSEDDIILVPGQGRMRRTGFVKNDPDRAEHEGETLKNSLHTIIRVASELDKQLALQSEFPEWVSEKIGTIKGMMTSVADYVISSKEMSHDADAMECGGGVIAGGSVGYEESVQESHYDDDYEDCSWCSGSGEGQYDGSTCSHCHGSGVEPASDNDDIDDIDYEDDADYDEPESHYEKSLRTRGLGEGSGKLNELSKGTMSNYVNKAVDDVSNRGQAAGMHRGARVASQVFAGGKKEPGRFEKDPKIDKRKVGISHAVSKLAKKEVDEGAKVDRMVKHIEKSEKKLGHTKKEAENIAWATANKRGMLDNKNKKK